MDNNPAVKDVIAFTESWQENEQQTKKAFLAFFDHIQTLAGLELRFDGRPGVTYSLRLKHPNQKDRDLFGMVDVIDDDPSDRWLSICFYEDLITDPDEMGDLIPEGLSGDDGYCFDLDEWEDGFVNYMKARLTEAYKNAAA